MDRIERYKKVGKLSFPIMLSFLSFQLLGITDMIMVSYLGKGAIVSVGIALTLYFFYSFSVEGFLDGITISISKANGENNMQEIRNIIKNGILFSIILGLIGVVLFLPLSKVLEFMTSSKEVIANSRIYLFISLISVIPQMITGIFIRFMLGIQKNKSVALISNVIVIYNVVLCYILIFGKLGFPALGVTGSAIATLSAKIIGMLFAIIYFRKISKTYYKQTTKAKFAKKELKKIFVTGLPIAQTNFVEVSAWTIFVFFISRIGIAPMASHEIGMKIKDVAYLPGSALGVVTTTIAGNMAGKGDYKGIKIYVYTALKMAICIMAFLALFFFAIPEFFIQFFSKDKDVMENGIVVLRIMALYQISDAIFIVFRGALNGLNDTKFVRNMIIMGSWGIMVPVAFVLTSVFNMGVGGAWIGLTIYVTLVGIIYGVRFVKKVSVYERKNYELEKKSIA